ncbi:uncharacterized protein LOC130993111 [Salvia miltiorrhiza]|uniref:uncharacterized protein LOC130993111 n=1 Tax=Salvia miltiorrhiza TaxID=226208 RepID=UPI0025AC30B3|nr:uncharacterized protein LOC130993111 [Salvia miltiorrhiza]
MTRKWCREEGVVVVVYAERPRREKQGGRRRYHRNVVRGYNRRAELLDHARHLRPPAPQSHPPSQALTTDGTRKQSSLSSPTCFDKWSFFVTRFLRSMTIPKTTKDKHKRNHKSNVASTTKIKALVNSLKLKKQGSFVSKLLTALQKRR